MQNRWFFFVNIEWNPKKWPCCSLTISTIYGVALESVKWTRKSDADESQQTFENFHFLWLSGALSGVLAIFTSCESQQRALVANTTALNHSPLRCKQVEMVPFQIGRSVFFRFAWRHSRLKMCCVHDNQNIEVMFVFIVLFMENTSKF